MSTSLQDGILLLQEGDLEGAEATFLRLLEADANDAAARLWLGQCYLLIGDLSKAAASFRVLRECEDEAIRKEAERELRTLWYKRVMHFLVVSPPLRYVLFFSVIGYVMSWSLRMFGKNEPAASIELLAVWIALPLFFLWALFIVSYYVGGIALVPPEQRTSASKSARIAILLVMIFVLPAYFFRSYGIGVKILSVFLNSFLICLVLGRLLHKVGELLTPTEPDEEAIAAFSSEDTPS
jgi:tetratricopeptide (TPR) repeat protein